MKIFDAHVHIFPDKIAAKAAVNIGRFYDIPMHFDGSVAALMALIDKAGVSGCLVHSVATSPAQTESINNFISDSVKANPTRFVGFCSVHPDMEKKLLEAEIDRAISLGLKGIKLHPDFQKFAIDDRKAYNIYEIADDRRLPILFHTGDYRYEWSSPKRLASVLKDFPALTVIGAHFGGWSEWDEGEKYLAERENVYVDTSSSLYSITPEKAKEYINAFGVDRVMFGTDYPMWDVNDELKLIERVDISDSDREKIMYKNACRLFGFEIKN